MRRVARALTWHPARARRPLRSCTRTSRGAGTCSTACERGRGAPAGGTASRAAASSPQPVFSPCRCYKRGAAAALGPSRAAHQSSSSSSSGSHSNGSALTSAAASAARRSAAASAFARASSTRMLSSSSITLNVPISRPSTPAHLRAVSAQRPVSQRARARCSGRASAAAGAGAARRCVAGVARVCVRARTRRAAAAAAARAAAAAARAAPSARLRRQCGAEGRACSRAPQWPQPARAPPPPARAPARVAPAAPHATSAHGALLTAPRGRCQR
jgi:hypothetical protein